MSKHKSIPSVAGQFDTIIEQINTLNNTTKQTANLFVKAHPLIGKAFCKMGRAYGEVIKKCNVFSQHAKVIVFQGEAFLDDFKVYLEDEEDFSADDMKECMVEFREYAKKVSGLSDKSALLKKEFAKFQGEVKDLKVNLNKQKDLLKKQQIKEKELRLKDASLKKALEEAKAESKKNDTGFLGVVTGFLQKGAAMVTERVIAVGASIAKNIVSGVVGKVDAILGKKFGEQINGAIDDLADQLGNAVIGAIGGSSSPDKSVNIKQAIKSIDTASEDADKMMLQADKCVSSLNKFEASLEQVQKVLDDFLSYKEKGETLGKGSEKVISKMKRLKLARKFLKNTAKNLTKVVEQLKKDAQKFDNAVEQSWKVYINDVYPCFVNE